MRRSWGHGVSGGNLLCQHPTGHIPSAKMSHEVKPDQGMETRVTGSPHFSWNFSPTTAPKVPCPQSPSPGQPRGLGHRRSRQHPLGETEKSRCQAGRGAGSKSWHSFNLSCGEVRVCM